jgi:hypothetical protein
MHPNGRCVNLCYNCYRLCPRLQTHPRIYQTVSTSCSGCLWANIVRTCPFTIRLLSISNFARSLRNIFSPAGSGFQYYMVKQYIAKDLQYLFHVYSVLCIQFPLENSMWEYPRMWEFSEEVLPHCFYQHYRLSVQVYLQRANVSEMIFPCCPWLEWRCELMMTILY